MTVPAIGGLPSLPSLPSVTPTGGASAAADAAQSFGDMVASGIENLDQAQQTADGLAQAASTGDLTDLHDYMIASTQAQLTTELTVNVRNKAVEAFNDIMRMQI